MPLILDADPPLEPDGQGLKQLASLCSTFETLLYECRDFILSNPDYGSAVFQKTDAYAKERNVFSLVRFRPSDTPGEMKLWINDRLFELRAVGADIKRVLLAGLTVVPSLDGGDLEYRACLVTPGRDTKDDPVLTAPNLRGLVVNDDYLKGRRQPGSDFKPSKK
jgi:hypothetical protein